jgi:energy-converting hydrogenase Eha subunit C
MRSPRDYSRAAKVMTASGVCLVLAVGLCVASSGLGDLFGFALFSVGALSLLAAVALFGVAFYGVFRELLKDN